MFRGSNTKSYGELKHIREYISQTTKKYQDLNILDYTKVATDILLQNRDAIQNKTVLELGCADGKTLATMQSMVPDFSYEGGDFSDVAIKSAKEKFENIVFKNRDLLLNSIEENCGVICMFETIEHIEEGTNYKILDNILDHCEYAIISTVDTLDDCFGEHISHYTIDTFDQKGYNVIGKTYLNEIIMPDDIYHYMIFLLKGNL